MKRVIKLPDDTVRQIRWMLRHGAGVRRLARLVQVSPAYISLIGSGKRKTGVQEKDEITDAE